MRLFLTSSPCDDHVPDGVDLPCVFSERNGFVKHLRDCVSPGASLVIAAADPDNGPLNDEMLQTFAGCFAYHGMPLTRAAVVDSRNAEALPTLLAACDVLLLAGGHVPTENAFFRRLGLKEALRDFKGVVIGVSAGSMNCAELVYAQPEEPGEAVDPCYRRFVPGLGLTRVNILPHYQQVRNHRLDGMRLFEDITYGDSAGHLFFALPDGSYIVEKDGEAMLCGEGYAIREGGIRMICHEGETVALNLGGTSKKAACREPNRKKRIKVNKPLTQDQGTASGG